MKLLLLLTTLCVFFFQHYCEADHHKLVIIGAGSSGIAAATRLLENDFTDFIILEAENRTGGRIFSVPFGNGIVDLGAQFCQGEKNNIVYETVKDLDVLKHHDNGTYVNLYTKFKIDKNVTETINNLFDSIYENVEDDVKESSLQEYFVKRFTNAINKLYSDSPKLLEFAKDCTDFFLGAICSIEGAFNASDISPHESYEEIPGDQYMHWNGKGYKTFLDVLMKKYPNPNESLPIDDKILLNKEVANVDWRTENSNSSKVAIKCSNGETYYAEHVIVTVSLGVLKENLETMFNPRLPIEKVRAIEDIGFGAISEIHLWYEHSWWPENLTLMNFIWTEQERRTLRDNGLEWYLNVLSLAPQIGNRNELCLWIAGDDVPKIEQLPDSEILSGITYIFDLFLRKDYNITQPSKILRSKWHSQPHFRGSYSYPSIKMNANNTLREDLGNPLLYPNTTKPIVFFAGEATNPHHFATVHGATETGFREADRILKLYKTQ
ncbi:spermine oxidase-like [Agrilus planipennis]|uniref:Spermine oxidase-like n=1 Tax=Agrilus planipennis TaxID=224129 RepID=A0A1W4WH11_AGRPL|nr:spermine oxidase-like [Agrilus planipennis]